MASIEITLRDDDGKLLEQSRPYPLNISSHSLHDIEGAVELFKRLALPDIEASFLHAAQEKLIVDKKTP